MPMKDPFDELEDMQERMNKLMKNFWQRGPRAAGALRGFPVDIREDNGNLIVEADLPGVDKDNVVVKVRDNQIMISCQEEDKKEESGENYYRQERSKTGMKRKITLPEKVKSDDASAKMEEGVLKVIIPKKAGKKKKERDIEVK